MSPFSVLENGNVEVSWEHIPSAPASTVYSLFHSDSENGPFTIVDSIFYPDNTFLHNIVNANNESQYYYLTSLSSCADESAPSDTLKSIKLEGIGINGDTEADLNWNEIHLYNLPTSFLQYNIYALDGNFDWQNVGSSLNTNYIFPAQTCNSPQKLYIGL